MEEWIYWQGKIFRHFSLLLWSSFIGQLVDPVDEREDWVNGVYGGIVGLANYEHHFNRLHENLVQHPSNNI